MTKLELVHHVTKHVGNSGTNVRTTREVVAVSSSYSALAEHCKDTFGQEVEKAEDCESGKMRMNYLTIHESNIAIVPAKF